MHHEIQMNFRLHTIIFMSHDFTKRKLLWGDEGLWDTMEEIDKRMIIVHIYTHTLGVGNMS